ncbi:HAD family acid phosphatase [Streptomyces muensis]|uniref:Hydrolase n=1 Tax=Streptomyces muensis TaxID=1077944 RepID=A0A9X1Q2C0_STRM4|nr:HAD family acid phosphatase [Streptomyces muensis]MCF1596031.1 hydrolase [Streptomyces muensis]
MVRTLPGARVAAAALAALTLGVVGATNAHAEVGNQVQPAEAEAAAVDYDTWQKDVSEAVDGARRYVVQRLSDGTVRKLAIVLDIDNTSLETHFHPFPPTPAVKPTLELARYAHDRGAAVFFITARPDLIGMVTKTNLESVGYPLTGLYQRNIGDLFRDTAEFKTAKRAEIEANGYTIIANIGNNTSDLVGGHADRTFKLPDYDGALS